MYTAIFDGLRIYYARYQSRRAAAGFHAAMSMSFLFCCSLIAGTIIADYLVNGSVESIPVIHSNKFALLLVGGAVAYAHVIFAKSTGRYNDIGSVAPAHWKAYLSAYCCLAAGLLAIALWLAAVK